MPAIFSSASGRSLCVLAIIAMVLSITFSFASAARPRGHALTKAYTYEHFVRDFHHENRDAKEHAFRRALFYKRRDEAIAHNNQGKSWTKGINQFSDYTEEEIQALGNKNFHSMLRASTIKPTKVHKVEGSPSFPFALDYRTATPAVLSSPKDQGHCGSCWAHSSTETIESHSAIVTGELFVLAQQQVSSCTPDPNQCGGTGGCQGNIHQLAYDYVTKNGGITEEWQYPYISYFGKDFDCKAPAKNQIVATIDGYTQVNRNDATSTMSALQNGPMSIVVAAVPFLDYDGGVFKGCDYSTNNTELDHGVQMVGYGRDTGLNMNYWIVRNSWSSNWGENGFIRMFRAADGQSEACGWDNSPGTGIACKGDTTPEWICGECGLLYDITYPNVKAPAQ